MNVIFFEVDGILNFKGSEALAPDGTMGIAESRVKALRRYVDATNSRLVLYGNWCKDWDFNDALCTPKGIYLNKKLSRRGLHILEKVKAGETVQDWLTRHQNIEQHIVLKPEGEWLE